MQFFFFYFFYLQYTVTLSLFYASLDISICNKKCLEKKAARQYAPNKWLH